MVIAITSESMTITPSNMNLIDTCLNNLRQRTKRDESERILPRQVILLNDCTERLILTVVNQHHRI